METRYIMNDAIDNRNCRTDRGGYPFYGQSGMSCADKMFLDSVVRRQELAMKNLFLLADRYPGLIPSEALGGLYAINTLLQDCRESAIRR